MAKPYLESLPAELRILILRQIPDLDSLKSIVLSSRGYYDAYLAARQEILCSIFNTQYGSLIDMADALTVVRSRGLLMMFKKEEALAVLDAWRRRAEIRELGLTPSIQLDKPSSLEETIKVFHLCRVWHFFLEDFSKNMAQPEWMEATHWDLPLHLSDTEQRRFLRALCRLHLWCNIFGREENQDEFRKGPDAGLGRYWESHYAPDDYYAFWPNMAPWECEEVGCVWSYLRARYDTLSKKICTYFRNLTLLKPTRYHMWLSDLVPEGEPVEGHAIMLIQDLERFPRYSESLILLGPEFLYRAMNADDDLLQRNMILGKMSTYTDYCYVGFLASFWHGRVYDVLPETHLNIPGFEQLWSTVPPFEQPNIAWKTAWLVPHTPQQRLRDSINRDRKRGRSWEWGYAIWDEKRLEGWKDDWKAQLDKGPWLDATATLRRRILEAM